MYAFQQQTKIIGLELIKGPNNKLVFFLVLLISCSLRPLYAQTGGIDTLKKVTADTLSSSDGEEMLEEKIPYFAQDSAVAMPKQKRMLLYGKSKVGYGIMTIESEFIEIDYATNMVTAYGGKDSLGRPFGTPVFKDGNETLEADKIMYNLKTKKGKIFNALTKQGELLVVGGQIKKDSTNIVYMKDMKCIPCQEKDARTVFRATKAKIIPNDKIITGPMYLEVGGVPTPLGLPFGYFPNTKKQHNGILLPTYNRSDALGFGLKNGGFYWGINEKTDMVIQGDIYTNGSWALKTTNRYNVLYKADGNVFLSYSEFNFGDRDVPAEFKKQKMYEIRWSHRQDNKNNPTSRFSANVNYVKNQEYNRFNADNSRQFLTNTFLSRINYTKMFKSSSLSINGEHSQNAETKNVKLVLPSITFNVNRFFPFKRENAIKQNVFDKIGINYVLLANNILSGKEENILKGSIIDSLNYGLTHSLPISTNFNLFKYITVTPAIQLSSVMYTKTIRKDFIRNGDGTSQIVTRTVNAPSAGYDASFSTAFNTQVYFDYMYKRGRIKQIRHLMIPTLSYNYRPDFGEAQYGFWKNVQTDTIGNIARYSVFERGIFYGPAVGKQNALSLNLNNSIEAKLKQKTDTGITYKKVPLIQNVSTGLSYNFAADSFKMSQITLTARTVVFKTINIVMSSAYDPYVYDNINKRRTSRYYWNYDKRIARFTNATFNVTTDVTDKILNVLGAGKDKSTENNQSAAVDPNKPTWSMGLAYNLSLSDFDNTKIQPTHNIGATINMSPTKFWKISTTTGFDFSTLKMSTTNVRVTRDLKCWEAYVDWVPFGIWKKYGLGISLKTSMLRDLKFDWPHQSTVQ